MSTEWFNDVKVKISERIADPFVGTLVISFLVWNWKFFYFIIFAKSEVSIVLNKSIEYFNYGSILWPIVISLGYIFIYSFVKMGIALFIEWVEVCTLNKKNDIKNKIRLTNEEMVEERKEDRAKISKLINQTESLLREIIEAYEETLGVKTKGTIKFYKYNSRIEVGKIYQDRYGELYIPGGFFPRSNTLTPIAPTYFYVFRTCGLNYHIGVEIKKESTPIPTPQSLKESVDKKFEYFNKNGEEKENISENEIGFIIEKDTDEKSFIKIKD